MSNGVNNDIILQLNRVSKIYGSNQVVNQVSIDLKEGEIVTLLGPSGCGKTTSLRMVAGLEKCDGGEIIYKGEVVDSSRQKKFIPTDKRNMGMVFQSYAIWPHMTVFENVAFPLRIRKTKENVIKQEVQRVLELVGLGAMSDRRSTQLSGGQQQRVALARSLVFRPNILLLDEPFSNLDAKLREQMRIEVKQLQKSLGITVLFVTHDQLEALGLSDRIVVMNLGKVEQIDTPRNLYEDPQTPFVRDFLGSTLMFNGNVSSVDERGEIAVSVEGSTTDTLLLTKKHFLKEPKQGDKCFIFARPEEISVWPVEAETETKAGSISLRGRIKTLLFLGERFETQISLTNGVNLMLYLPKTLGWHEGQNVSLRLSEGVSVWQN